ncbi:MAG: hydroxymethylglutaryl-CoA reductase, partial [Bacteroidota bacterium]
MQIPELILRQLYTLGSLENTDTGVQFSLKNRLTDVELAGLSKVAIDGEAADLSAVTLSFGDGGTTTAQALGQEGNVPFALRQIVDVTIHDTTLEVGRHEVELGFEAAGLGELTFSVQDAIKGEEAVDNDPSHKIPRASGEDDYSPKQAAVRRSFAEQFAGSKLDHVGHFSVDPTTLRGNIEHFTGVAQIPLGLAGPLNVHGEHANGEYIIPLATTEGTLVASYNRGMQVINLSGGVKSTVSDDRMQRAPVFVFDSAREARDFRGWVHTNWEPIAAAAEATSSVAKLLEIDTYLANKFAFLRFNYSTGDAAGQNMVGRATFAACSWILEQDWPKNNVRHFYLESNFATDKKASMVNIMRTRGKRVTAEAIIKREVLEQRMRVTPENLHYHAQIANVGAFMSGANNNGCHSPNLVTALFIATGQDVANVSESSAAIVFTELTNDGDLYMSITIPSLIVATYGGGTGIGTQRECLELLGCFGRDKAKKFAEIVAGAALAGELSLAAAISSNDWV